MWVLLPFLYFLQKRIKSYANGFHLFSAIWIHICAVMTSSVISLSISLFVGRARPDFFSRCGTFSTQDTCTMLTSSELDDEFRSFPSGGCTLASSSMIFLSLFLQKYSKTDGIWLHCIFLIPCFLGMFTGSLSIRFYKNHPDDAIAGFFVGSVCSYIIWRGSYKRIFGNENQEDIVN
ncbi:PAP2 superfamily protein [Histomonas meleagridis]|nr:PAP2 superfamily protein [Histomonas meleagridis]